MRQTMLLIGLTLLTLTAGAPAQESGGIDPEALIARILAVESEQRAKLQDVTYESEYREGKREEGEFIEETRFAKRVQIKYEKDTALFHETILEYYKKGELQSADDRDGEAKTRAEKKKRRGGMDISFPMLRPFEPPWRALYDIAYAGIPSEPLDGRLCHKFEVRATDPADSLINATYYFEADGFHLVRVDFSPSKLTRNLMFKMSEFNMSLQYGPGPEGHWLPRQFDISMKAKAAFFKNVRVLGTEYYRNPVINTGLGRELFEGRHD